MLFYKGRWTILVLLFLFTFYQTVQCQCGRSLSYYTATHEYQEFESPGYPFYYLNNYYCNWRLEAQNETDAIKVEFLDSSIEYDYFCSYDYCQVFDGLAAIYSDSLGKFCGTSTPTYVSTNNTMSVIFVTDSSTTSYGFKARYKSGPRCKSATASLLGDESVGSIDLAVALGATFGCLAFVILLSVIFVLAYKYKQAKKMSAARPSQRTPRPLTSIRVRPSDSSFNESHYHGQLPPAYEDIQGPSSSLPPAYSADNHFPYTAATAFPRYIDSSPNNWSSEKKFPLEKKPLDDKTDTVPNSRFLPSSSRRGTVTNIGNNVVGSSTAGTSGVNSMHTLNPAALGTGAKNIETDSFVSSALQDKTSSSRHSSKPRSQRLDSRPTEEYAVKTNTEAKETVSTRSNPSNTEPEMFYRRNAAISPRGKSLTKNAKVSPQIHSDETLTSARRMTSQGANNRLSTTVNTITRPPEAKSDNANTSRQETAVDSMSISSEVSIESILK